MKKVLINRTQISTKKTTKKTSPNKQPQKKIYQIIWRDAYSDPDEWICENDEENFSKDYICSSVGHLLTTDPKDNYYKLAGTYTQDGNYCSAINIPKKMVIKKTRLN